MKYLYLRAWCRLLGSFPSFTECEVARAEAEQAPQTAVYRRLDGAWVTFEEIQSEATKQAVQVIVRKLESHSGREEELTHG